MVYKKAYIQAEIPGGHPDMQVYTMQMHEQWFWNVS